MIRARVGVEQSTRGATAVRSEPQLLTESRLDILQL